MPEVDNNNKLVSDLEQRIDAMQHMGDDELGSFTQTDWLILVLVCLVLPLVAVVLGR